MRNFSEELESFIRGRKITVYSLAERSGVDRTLIHKMMKGERVPAKESVVRALASELMLTPEESAELLESYRAAKMGRDVYARRKAVLDFYNGFPTPPESSLREESRAPARVPVEDGTVSGKLEVGNLIGAVLESEAAREKGRVCILAQPECPILFDLLPLVGMRRQNLTVDHVICLENSGSEAGHNALYNLGCLGAVMPVLASGCRYRPRYYYGSADRFGEAGMMPNLILTGNYLVRISHDASCAAISSFSPYLELYGRAFDSLSEKSMPLATVFCTPQEEISYISRLYSEFTAVEDDFTSDPCLLPFAGEEMTRRYTAPALMKDGRDARMILEYMDSVHLKNRIRNLGNVFFSEEGIDRFLSTGRITEVPTGFYSPLELPDRYRLLRGMFEASLAGKYHPVLVDARRLRIPESLSTYTFRNGAVCFIYTAPGYEYTAFTVSEASTVAAVRDFMGWLPKSSLVCSSAETLRYLKEKLTVVQGDSSGLIFFRGIFLETKAVEKQDQQMEDHEERILWKAIGNSRQKHEETLMDTGKTQYP